MLRQNYYRLLYAIAFVLVFCSCKPVIHSFRVTPLVITGDEKVRLEWDVEGKPSLEFNEHTSVDSVQLLEYTLVVTRGGKVARQTVQVQKRKPQAPIEISFFTNKREGDSVIASGENNINQWNGFQVVSVSSASSRDLVVTHSGRSAVLKADGANSPAFSGTPAGGEWFFKTRLTAIEIADSTKIPQELKIKAVIKPSNQ